MSAVLDSPQARERVLPLSVAAYHELGARGMIPERSELLRGVIFEKMPKSRLHVRLVRLLEQWLRLQLPADFLLQKEDPITCVDSEPEPDLALIRGQEADFADEHPRTAELIIEVSVSTEDTDRSKAAVYAEAGVKEYWLVLPESRSIEVFTQPSSSGYASHDIMTDVATSAVLPEFRVKLSELFADV
ncbi:MAG TPA: Uma2 family endonuclease [Verrucomicrobiales bacterium]|nr:Uma2 family endonuclease [Verrucomicrobiales bacterium]